MLKRIVLTFTKPVGRRCFAMGLKRPKLSDTFNFPKHSEYLSEDHFYQEGDENTKVEEQKGDFLAQYDRLLNLTAEDVIESQFETEKAQNEKRMGQFFENASDREIMNATKAFIQNANRRRPLEMSPQFLKGRIQDDYAEYAKYEENFMETQKEDYQELDRDVTKTRRQGKMYEFWARMNTAQGHQEIKKRKGQVENAKRQINRYPHLSNHAKDTMNYDMGEIFQKEEHNPAMRDLAFPDQRGARMSPFARDQIYLKYLEGWTIKEISLRYGIIPQRAKVIVYFRHLFWHYVYPKIGETGLRMAYQIQFESAERTPFQDYGLDIDRFGEFEGGVLCQDYQRTQFDYHPNKEDRIKMVKTYRTELRSIKYKIVPEKFVGKFGRGYMIQHINQIRGKGSPKVNQRYRDIINWGSKKETHYMLPKKAKENLKHGPRLAYMRYRAARKKKDKEY